MEKKAPSSEATRPKAEASSSKVRTLGMECHFESTVAVGTTITGRPPHRSVRARLCIRLLPRMMASVEAFVGIRMQNLGLGNPSVQQWGKT